MLYLNYIVAYFGCWFVGSRVLSHQPSSMVSVTACQGKSADRQVFDVFSPVFFAEGWTQKFRRGKGRRDVELILFCGGFLRSSMLYMSYSNRNHYLTAVESSCINIRFQVEERIYTIYTTILSIQQWVSRWLLAIFKTMSFSNRNHYY